MKKIIIFILFLVVHTTFAQDRLSSINGITNFEASIPFFEEIKAVNNKTNGTLITTSGQILFSLYIRDFEFQRTLMQEHFNSIYMESNRYPKAVFKGKIENLNLKTINTIKAAYQIKGRIIIKGRSKNIAIKANIAKVKNGYEFTTEFPLNTDDFNIEIPFVVRSKVSKTVNTTVFCFLQ